MTRLIPIYQVEQKNVVKNNFRSRCLHSYLLKTSLVFESRIIFCIIISMAYTKFILRIDIAALSNSSGRASVCLDDLVTFNHMVADGRGRKEPLLRWRVKATSVLNESVNKCHFFQKNKRINLIVCKTSCDVEGFQELYCSHFNSELFSES